MFLSLCILLTLGSLQVSGRSFWDSDFSQNAFATYSYRGQFSVTIFRNVNKQNKFYFSPLVIFNHRSGNIVYNILLHKYELRYDVLMYTDDFRNDVLHYLVTKKGIVNPEIDLMPMEKYSFDWTATRTQKIRPRFQLETEFRSINHSPHALTMIFVCNNRTELNELNNGVKENPVIMDRMEMKYLTHVQQSSMKTIKITSESLQSSKMLAKLKSMSTTNGNVYLKGDDYNKLVQEAFESVTASVVRTNQYVEQADEVSMKELLNNIMKKDVQSSATFSEATWKSVFWDDENTRPDKVTKTLNKAVSKSKTKDHVILDEKALNEIDKKSGTEFALDVKYKLLFNAKTKFKTEDKSSAKNQSSLSTNELKELLRDVSEYVEWDGEKIVPKSLNLVRVNIATLKGKKDLATTSVQLGTIERHDRLDVQIIRDKTNATLLALSSVEFGFPTKYSYCILSNGGLCPPGFKRSYGFIKSIMIDENSANMVQPGFFGDSSIQCHSPPSTPNNCSFKDWGPYKGELHLYTCCIS